MATELAIETSDVDLVVTGINSLGRDSGGHHSNSSGSYGGGDQYGGTKNQLLKMMSILHEKLQKLKGKGFIHRVKFIQGANVPIIKLVVDLQVVNSRQVEKAKAEVLKERKEIRNKKREESKKGGSVAHFEDEAEEEINFSELGIEPR